MSENKDQTGIPLQPDTLVHKHPPLWQELVIELFFRPRRFFSDLSILMQTKYVVVVTWFFGMSQTMDRIDMELLKAEMGSSSRRTEFVTGLLDTWITYWGVVLVYGSISGLFLWWVGGWWYRKRLEWSGAVDPDHRLARVVYIYASFVVAAPTVIITLIETSIYDNYIQAYNSESLWPVIILIFPFWSLITSYIGIRTIFDVSRWKARIWFIILPGILYLIFFGGLVALFALLQNQ